MSDSLPPFNRCIHGVYSPDGSLKENKVCSICRSSLGIAATPAPVGSEILDKLKARTNAEIADEEFVEQREKLLLGIESESQGKEVDSDESEEADETEVFEVEDAEELV